MADWSAGYVTEISYSYGFYRELTPSLLAFAALVRGVDAPGLGSEPLRVLELGCGQGESAIIVAAARPEVDYTAIDFNPAHVAGAANLARKAGLKNLTLRDASFAEIASDESLGLFDVITLHGVYTWVSAENREHILKIANDRLRPGGTLYVSYNCHPGWTPVIPMRRLITDLAATMPRASVADRVRTSLDAINRLATANAKAIGSVPGLKERIERLGTMAPNYIAHEYLNADWTIFHSADVNAEMTRAKLSFVGSANVTETVEQLNFTPDQQALMAGQSDPVLRETFRDIITNQQFRRDIFMRGPLPLRAEEGRNRWLDLRLALLMRAQDVPRKITGLAGEVELHAPTYDAILNVLDRGPCTVHELMGDTAVAALGGARVQQAVTILIGVNALAPALPAANEGLRFKRAEALNTVFLDRARFSADHNFLASPVTGSGFAIDRIGQLIVLARRTKAEPVPFVWQILAGQGQRLVKDGKTIEGEVDNLAELSARVSAFDEKIAPVLKRLKIG